MERIFDKGVVESLANKGFFDGFDYYFIGFEIHKQRKTGHKNLPF